MSMGLLYSPANRNANRATPPRASITAGLISNRLRVRATATAMAISPSPLSVSPREITAAAISPSTAGVSPRSAARTGLRERRAEDADGGHHPAEPSMAQISDESGEQEHGARGELSDGDGIRELPFAQPMLAGDHLLEVGNDGETPAVG